MGETLLLVPQVHSGVLRKKKEYFRGKRALQKEMQTLFLAGGRDTLYGCPFQNSMSF